MNEGDRLDLAKWTLERQLAWIAAVEVKIGVIIAINTGMIAGVASVFDEAEVKSIMALTLSGFSVGFSVISLVIAAIAVWPQTKGPSQSFFFFGRISRYSVDDYSRCFKVATESTLVDDLLAQIHRNAEIAASKYGYVSNAIKTSAISAVLWVSAVIILIKI